jgi:uncharacterized Zn-binding protein involved in type VI secretion
MFAPAARLNDNHVCLFVNPAIIPVPHVGGPIAFVGAPTCLIEGMAAARQGDCCQCYIGPPAPIITGSLTVYIEGLPAARVGDQTAHGGMIIPPAAMTVLIGDLGLGAGSMAVATMSAARNNASAFVRTDCAAQAAIKDQQGGPVTFEGDPTKKSWIEIELVDQHSKPVPHMRYRVVPPGAGVKPIEGFLNADGYAKVTGIDPGTCKITFPDLDASSWKPEKGDPGRRRNPEPPPEIPGRPGVRKTSVHIEVVARPPAVKRGTVALKVVEVPLPTKPGLKRPSVALRVLAAPSIRRASVALRRVSGPSIQRQSLTLRLVTGPSIQRQSLTLRLVTGPSIQRNTLTLTRISDPSIRRDTIALRLVREPSLQAGSVSLRVITPPSIKSSSVALTVL